MCEMSVKNNQPSNADHSCPERSHQPPGEKSAVCLRLGETVAESTLRVGGRKIDATLLAQGNVPNRMETCSPGQLSPDQRAQLYNVLLLAAHSMISVDHPKMVAEPLPLNRPERRRSGFDVGRERHIEINVSGEKTLLWRASEGAYLALATSICRLCGTPPPHMPSPQTSLTVPGNETLVSPTVLLGVLQKLGRHVEALELAVVSAPERVAESIGEAGPQYQAQGLLARLHLLLESLEDKHQRDEKVLEWRLVAGFDQSDYAHILPAVKTYLQDNEAPELRARYAGTIPDVAESFAQAQRAAAAKRTLLTLSQLGHLHPDNQEGAKILRESIRLAETSGDVLGTVRSSAGLAEIYTNLGQFGDAASWSAWALKRFEQEGLMDGSMRLRLHHIYATARILNGDTNGLRAVLLQAEEASRAAEINIANDFRQVLAHLELVLGNVVEAEKLATERFEQGPRWRLGDAAMSLVRTLLEQGKNGEALDRARYALSLVEGDDDFYSLPASLALGMVCAFTEPAVAPRYLIPVLAARELEAAFRATAALHLLKADALRFEDLEPEMRELLQSSSPTALRLFSGPETEFVGVWNTFAARRMPLRIRVLGRTEVWLDDKRLDLSERALEIVVLLALHPEGLTSEALHSHLYGKDDVKLGAVRAAVSRLRALVPIGGQAGAHRITVPFTLDASECETALAAGDLRTALSLYRGPLLEKSDAPGVHEARLYLEERLRQSALHAGDAETLLPLAETLRNDLELWEALHAALPLGDRRLPLVRAQLQRVTQELQPTYN